MGSNSGRNSLRTVTKEVRTYLGGEEGSSSSSSSSNQEKNADAVCCLRPAEGLVSAARNKILPYLAGENCREEAPRRGHPCCVRVLLQGVLSSPPESGIVLPVTCLFFGLGLGLGLVLPVTCLFCVSEAT